MIYDQEYINLNKIADNYRFSALDKISSVVEIESIYLGENSFMAYISRTYKSKEKR